MSARRWQIVGGWVAALIFIAVANGLEDLYLSGGQWSVGGIIIAIGAGIVGHALGQYTVRAWQEAGDGKR